MKRLSISIQDWIFEQYLFNASNVSARCEELIIKGSEVEEGKFEATKRRVLMLKDELKLRDEEIAKLKQHIGRLESAIDKQQISVQKKMVQFENLAEDAIQCDVCGEIISAAGKKHKFPIGNICSTCFETGRDNHLWFKNPKEQDGGK